MDKYIKKGKDWIKNPEIAERKKAKLLKAKLKAEKLKAKK